MAEPNILIVGATGRLGTRLVKRLSDAGARPRALVRSADKGAAIARFATPVVGDLLSPDTVKEAFREIERVFIVAPPTPDMEQLERNAIDAAVAAGARHVVYLSNFAAREGSELRPNHIHGYHERLVSSLGIDWTVIGPTRYMTNLPFDWAPVLNDGLLRESGGDGIMTCIDPDDVTTIATQVLTEDGHSDQVYRLTSEDAFTARDLAALLSDFLGKDVRVDDTDRGPSPLNSYFELVAAGVYHTTDTAAKLLGHPPRSYLDWLKKNPPTG
jgi:uncharacterized protein YbjT (DUF2867 family)